MQIQNTRPLAYVPGFPADADALTDTTPDVTDATPLPSRQKQAVDALLGDKVSEKARARISDVLRVYPAPVLENLKKFGLSFEITQGQGAMGNGNGQVALGGYDPVHKKIMFDEGVLMAKLGRHMLTHELVHSIDAMRGERDFGKAKDPILASSKDKELLGLYAAYQARGAVEAIGQLRYALKDSNNGTLPVEGHIQGADNWGALDVNYRRQDGQEVFKIDQQPKMPKGFMESIAEAVGAAAPDRIARDLPRTEVDVELRKGGTAHVVQEGTVSEVTVKEGAISYTGDIWSDYAHRSGMVEEYMAEAVSYYLEKGNVREEMEAADPAVVSYVEKFIDQEFNLTP